MYVSCAALNQTKYQCEILAMWRVGCLNSQVYYYDIDIIHSQAQKTTNRPGIR